MFSNTAYEAFYEYLGLQFQAEFIKLITSHNFFRALILLIFGVMFFVAVIQFFSRYTPGSLIKRRQVPLSRIIIVVFFLFFGMTLLRVGSTTHISRFNGESWHDNPYIVSKMNSVPSEYRVSFVFDLLSRSAEEVSRLMARVIDGFFKKTNSQLDSPNLFFKAIMFASSATIEDPKLKSKIDVYNQECLQKVLPYVSDTYQTEKVDGLFRANPGIERMLEQLEIPTSDKTSITCLELKEDLRDDLYKYSAPKFTNLQKVMDVAGRMGVFDDENMWRNIVTSNSLVNYYNDQREGSLGLQKGAQPPIGAARGFQYLSQLFSFAGLSNIFGAPGASTAASRSQEFNEALQRAPHLAGFIKMLLIACFPLLIFAVIAGYWRLLLYWYLVYFSVLLWTPLWTLLYHVMTEISLSAEVMETFGRLNDGISLYGADLIQSKFYYMFSIYSWIQTLIGPVLTGSMLYFLRPGLSDNRSEEAPEFIDTAASTAGTAGKMVGGL